MPKIKIYGNGWVGKSVHKLFPEALLHDPAQGLLAEDTIADVAFICVPTPLKDGKLDTSIVEELAHTIPEHIIVIRSTVNPGTCDRLEQYGRHIVYQPEYLGETVAHPLFDEASNNFMILGGKPENRRKVIELYQAAYNANIKIRQTSLLEAEVIKLSENRAIAFKIAQCQELYDACEAAGVDYYTVRDAVYGDDPRFNLFWTFIYPEKRGFQSKCLPKDVYGWKAWAESVGIKPTLTTTLLETNEEYLKNEAINHNS